MVISIQLEHLKMQKILACSENAVVYKTNFKERDYAVKILNDLMVLFESKFYAPLEESGLLKIEFFVEEAQKPIGYGMPYCPAGSLDKYTKLEETERYNNILNPIRDLKIALEIAIVLNDLHRKGEVYCFLSPENVLLNVDFDRRQIEEKNVEPLIKLTLPFERNEEKIRENPYYAPEVRDGQTATDKADSYSLAMVLYSMDHRKIPKKNFDMSCLRSDWNPKLAEIFRSCVNVNPDDRPSVNQILKALIEIEKESHINRVEQVSLNDFKFGKHLAHNESYITVRASSDTFLKIRINRKICENEQGKQVSVEVASQLFVVKLFIKGGRTKHIRREIENLCTLRHKHIQRIHLLVMNESFDEISGFVTDYFKNGSVGDYVYGEKFYASPKILTPENILRWFKQLASALKYCHSKKIIHRNLNPSKMLLRDDYKFIRLCDFGYSRVADLNMTASVGNHSFMAPEAINNEDFSQENQDKLDVWMFAMSLYTCCNKEKSKPFVEDFNENRALRTRRSKFKCYLLDGNRPRNDLDPAFPKAIKDIYVDGWKLEPEERPTIAQIYDRIDDGEGGSSDDEVEDEVAMDTTESPLRNVSREISMEA